MSLYKFLPNDVLVNQIKLHPEVEFFIYNGNVYYNNKSAVTGSHVNNVGHVDTGHISLYELNLDRHTDSKIYPFVTKQGSLTSFKTVSSADFNTDFNYGDTLTGSYPLSASITRTYYADDSTDYHITSSETDTRKRVEALRNTLEYYSTWNPHFKVSSSVRDLTTDELSIFDIPSIFYGSSIDKGSVELNFYVTGTLVGQAKDVYKNGSLVQILPENEKSGSNIGLVLYNEGFVLTHNPAPFSVDKALQLNGTNEAMSLYLGTTHYLNGQYGDPDNTDLDLDPQSDFTLSAWIKTSTAHGPIINKGTWGTNPDGYGLYMESNVLKGQVGGEVLSATTNIADGAWHHVALVNYNDSGAQKFQLYVDGTAEGTATESGYLVGDTKLYIGSRLSSAVVTNAYFNGTIDEMSVWDREITALEISDIYNSGCPNNLHVISDKYIKKHILSLDPLIAWWRFGDELGWRTPKEKQHPKNILSLDRRGKGNRPIYGQGYYVDSSNIVSANHSCTYDSIAPHMEAYTGASNLSASWAHFGASMTSGVTAVSSSFGLKFRGTTFTPVMTMFTHAPQGALNYSTNPTFIDRHSRTSSSLDQPLTSSAMYKEPEDILIKNIATSSYYNYEEKMSRQTFISKIGIYDKDKNLIAIAKLATPIRKEEKDEYVFKLKLDL